MHVPARLPSLAIGLMVALLMALAIGCQPKTVTKAPVGKGGLPLNTVEGMQASGTAGAAVTVPPELIYPGATAIPDRMLWYKASASVETVKAWALENVPGASEKQESKQWTTIRGTDWELRLGADGGSTVIQYFSTKYK